ncbi:uncharacterized protein LOC107592279 [Tachysurus ichikawai]
METNSETVLKASVAEADKKHQKAVEKHQKAAEKHQKSVETITQLEQEKINLRDQDSLAEAEKRHKKAEEKHQKSVETITQLEQEKHNLTDQEHHQQLKGHSTLKMEKDELKQSLTLSQHLLKAGEKVKFTLENVTDQDKGKIWCINEKIGTNSYDHKVDILVIKSTSMDKIINVIILVPVQTDSDEDLTEWITANTGSNTTDLLKQIKLALTKCANYTCALALMQHEELKVNKSCWLCLRLHLQRW